MEKIMKNLIKICIITFLLVLASTVLNASFVLTEIQLSEMKQISLSTTPSGFGGVTTDQTIVNGFYSAYDHVDTFNGDVGFWGLQQFLGVDYIYTDDATVFENVLDDGGVLFNLANDDDDHWQSWAMIVFVDPDTLLPRYQTNTGSSGISLQPLDLYAGGSGTTSLSTYGNHFAGINAEDILSVGFIMQNIKDEGGSDIYHVSASTPEPMSIAMVLSGTVLMFRRKAFRLLYN